jgi:hypothetical protein
MVGKLEGAVEKAVDTFRQNPTLRSEMILAIERIIEKTNENEDSHCMARSLIRVYRRRLIDGGNEWPTKTRGRV